jgi:hypothetical protein
MFSFFLSSLDAELAVKGYLFHKGRLKITVSKVFLFSQTGETQPMTQSHLVEISCIVGAGHVKLNIINLLKHFSWPFNSLYLN